MGYRAAPRKGVIICCCFCIVACVIGITIYFVSKVPKLDIELVSMEFTVLNITKTRLSARWDLSIKIPNNLPDVYICVHGDLQASILYKNVTLATASKKYKNLHYRSSQLLKVSTIVSEEYMSGFIGKDVMESIKERREVKFGSRFFLTDCRKKTKGVMRYACDEVILRFEPGSETKATEFGSHPTCINF